MPNLNELTDEQADHRGEVLGHAMICTCGDLTDASEAAVLVRAMAFVTQRIEELTDGDEDGEKPKCDGSGYLGGE